MALADAVVVLRAGRVEDHGPPERVYLRPSSLFSAGFMGDSNVLDGRVAERGPDGSVIETSLGGLRLPVEAPDDAVVLSIRPEHVHVDGSGDLALGDATVRERHFAGTYQRCFVTAGDVELLVFAPATMHLEVGSTVSLSVAASDVVVLQRS